MWLIFDDHKWLSSSLAQDFLLKTWWLMTSTNKGNLLFVFGTILFQGSRFAILVYTAKRIGPELFGLWQSLFLIISYGLNANLGILNTMNRDIPFYEGSGQIEKVIELRELGLESVKRISLILSFGIFISSFLFSKIEIQIALRYIALILIFQELYLYYQMLLKSHRMFCLMGQQQFIYSTSNFFVVFPLTYVFGFQGFMGGQVLALAVTLFFLKLTISMRITPFFNWAKVKKMIRIGFPIMLSGLIGGLITSVDRIMIIRFLGMEKLGYYSLSIMATGLFMLIPMIISQIIYPQMNIEYGKENPNKIKKMVYILNSSTILLLTCMTLILGASYFVLPILVVNFLPEYLPGISALKISIFGVFFLSISSGYGSLLITLRLQKAYLILQIIIVGMAVAFNWMALVMGFGVDGVAFATSMSHLFYTVMLVSFTNFSLKRLFPYEL